MTTARRNQPEPSMIQLNLHSVPDSNPSRSLTHPSTHCCHRPLLLLSVLLVLLLTLSLPRTVHSQHAPAVQNFVFYQLPNRRAVAQSTLDQGQLVLSHLRTRRSIEPLPTTGVFHSRVRRTREEEEEAAGGPVYECTSLDGPDCSFVKIGVSGNELVLKLLHQLVTHMHTDKAEVSAEQQQGEMREEESSEVTTGDGSSDESGSFAAADETTSADGHTSQHSTDDQLTVSDDTAASSQSTDATADATADTPLPDDEQAYYDELSSLSLSQLIMHRAAERDGQLHDAELDGADFEYELMTVGEDGLQREMTGEEKEELRQQLLNGEVEVDLEDDEAYWDEQAGEYNATSGEYGEDEELVANGVH